MMLMPIGRFAKASRLTVKSLRNYDESGLLPAHFVDPQSGYRYYAATQLARADAIRSLRMVGMPLALIAETLDGEDPERSLMSHLESLEHQRDELTRQASELRRRIDQKEYVMSTEVTVRNHPAMTAASWRTETTYATIFEHIPMGFEKVMTYLGSEGIAPAATPFTLYYQAPEGDAPGDIAMSVPVADGTDLDDAEFELTNIPAGSTACIVHKGSYANMGESYATVVSWITERGHGIVGPAREVYLNSPAEVDEDGLLTEIHFPIDGEAA